VAAEQNLREDERAYALPGAPVGVPQGRYAMTTYIMLASLTESGMRQVRASPRRLDEAKRLLAEMGGAYRAFYLTMGEYDLVAVYDAPDDAVAARFTLMLGLAGNVRTRTLKAFPEQAYREIINSLG
jgi:uncharacterized protein with GYD domain